MRKRTIVAAVIGIGLLLATSGCTAPWSKSSEAASEDIVPVWAGVITEEDSASLAGSPWVNPSAVVIIGQDAYVLDTGKDRIIRIVDVDDGSVGEVLCELGDNAWLLQGALAMTTHDGDLYIANTGASEVVILSTSDELLDIITIEKLQDSDQTPQPAGIAVTEDGDIWVSDQANHRVLCYNREGERLRYIGRARGEAGSSDYEFNTPMGLHIDKDGNLYVADYENGRVNKYSNQHKYLMEFMVLSHGNFSRPRYVTVSPEGIVYHSCGQHNRVEAFAPDGEYLNMVGMLDASRIDSPLATLNPYGVFHDQDRYLYVIDRYKGLLAFYIDPACWEEDEEEQQQEG